MVREERSLEKIILFHGTPNEIVMPTYGYGDEKHDYGKGFYLTADGYGAYNKI